MNPLSPPGSFEPIDEIEIGGDTAVRGDGRGPSGVHFFDSVSFFFT